MHSSPRFFSDLELGALLGVNVVIYLLHRIKALDNEPAHELMNKRKWIQARLTIEFELA